MKKKLFSYWGFDCYADALKKQNNFQKETDYVIQDLDAAKMYLMRNTYNDTRIHSHAVEHYTAQVNHEYSTLLPDDVLEMLKNKEKAGIFYV